MEEDHIEDLFYYLVFPVKFEDKKFPKNFQNPRPGVHHCLHPEVFYEGERNLVGG